MKLRHAAIGVVIFVVIAITFTAGGLLSELVVNYNVGSDDINISKFGGLDVSDKITDDTLGLRNSSKNPQEVELQLEDESNAKLSLMFGETGKVFNTGKSVIEEMIRQLGLGKTLLWAVSIILTIFIIWKTFGWVVDR